MPKLVSELASGSSNERSADGGALADVSTRSWRIILNSPTEAYNIAAAVGVRVGDPHPTNFIPCVSLSERADGESRLVRIVTATYRTSPGGGGVDNNQSDPNRQQPDVRPARLTISSSLIEEPAKKWREVTPTSTSLNLASGGAVDPLNPVGDRYDGVTVLVPMINIALEQFDTMPMLGVQNVGMINSDRFNFLGYDVMPGTCMIRGINVRPVVETFGDLIYRGWTRALEFAIKPPASTVGNDGGWWIEQILEGFNIKNTGLANNILFSDVDLGALNLEHVDGVIKGWPATPELAAGTQDKKMRAMVLITAQNGKAMQRPSAQPVALNTDGSPRDVQTQTPKVLTKKYITQPAVPFGDNFSNLGVRIAEVL